MTGTMAAPRAMPLRTTSQPVLPRLLRKPTVQLMRQASLDSPLSPDYVPDHVTVETRNVEGERVAWKVYVTEVSGRRTLDLYCEWSSVSETNRPPLTKLPLEVCDLNRLERLWASHNLLSSLPPTLSHLTHLRELLLHQNRFSEFPSPVCHLPNLELLWLSWNHIPSIPDEITNLRSLCQLHLDHNQISEFPASLCSLTKLQVLYLNHNVIERVSEGVGRLMRLRHLLLDHNLITELPRSMCDLKEVERLDLRHNQLKHLPLEFRNFQSEKNDDSTERKRVSTSDNPFDMPLSRMKSTDQSSPPLRPRTMSFPLSGRIRRSSDMRSPSPCRSPSYPYSLRPVFVHSQSEDTGP